MNSGFSVIELMELSPLLRQIVCLLLRNNTMSDRALYDTICIEGASFNPAQVKMALADLLNRDWLLYAREQGQDVYSLRLARSTRAGGGLWDSIGLEGLPMNARAANLRLGGSSNHAMQRGGKRAVPKNIWDRLGDEDERDTEDLLRPKGARSERALELLNRISGDDASAQPPEIALPSDTAASRIRRRKVWDALDG